MGKVVAQTNVKWEGDFFNLFLFPYQLSQLIPQKIQSVDLLAGSWGTVGSIIYSTYTIGGTKSFAKEMIEAIDEKKKSITLKMIEGDIMKFYSEFKTICDVESNEEGNHTVTYTLEYKPKSGQVAADPTDIMDFLIDFSKEIGENSRRLVPN